MTVENVGDVILFIMADQDVADAAKEAFLALCELKKYVIFKYYLLILLPAAHIVCILFGAHKGKKRGSCFWRVSFSICGASPNTASCCLHPLASATLAAGVSHTLTKGAETVKKWSQAALSQSLCPYLSFSNTPIS